MLLFMLWHKTRQANIMMILITYHIIITPFISNIQIISVTSYYPFKKTAWLTGLLLSFFVTILLLRKRMSPFVLCTVMWCCDLWWCPVPVAVNTVALRLHSFYYFTVWWSLGLFCSNGFAICVLCVQCAIWYFWWW